MPAGSKVDLLTIAASKWPKPSPQVIKLLLEHGADVQETHALHAAASMSGKWAAPDVEGKPDPARMEILQILLDAGVSVNQMEPDPKGPDSLARNGRQRTPNTGTALHHAVVEGSPEAVSYLLARGADLLAPSWSGHTVIQAAERTHREDREDILEVIALHQKQ
jgi:ankyrin repeat protein